jgi:uncharacterized protein YbjT (DUF2867 family)
MTTPFSPSDLVLVTGANGHVGQHVVDQLLGLPNGPRVRATVCSNGAAKQMMSFYKKKGIIKDRLEVFLLFDIIKPGAFDDVVKGIVMPLYTVTFDMDLT